MAYQDVTADLVELGEDIAATTSSSPVKASPPEKTDEEKNSQNEIEEREAFLHVIRVFRSYQKYGVFKVTQQIDQFKRLPERQQKLLPDFLELQQKRIGCVQKNMELINAMLERSEGLFMNVDYYEPTPEDCFVDDSGAPSAKRNLKTIIIEEKDAPVRRGIINKPVDFGGTKTDISGGDFSSTETLAKIKNYPPPQEPKKKRKVRAFDMDRLVSMMKHVVRDWSAEGAQERAESYGVVLAELDARAAGLSRCDVQVVVAGAGLSRLTHEVMARGYSCQGNEFSYMMLLASNFMLNWCHGKDQHLFYPYVLQTCNNYADEDMIRDLVSSSQWFVRLRGLGITLVHLQVILVILLSSIARSTLVSYLREVSRFLGWHQKTMGCEAKFPVDPFVISLYLVARAQAVGSSSSLTCIWAALKWAHDFYGDAYQFSDRYLNRILNGLLRVKAKPPQRKKPITTGMVEKIIRLNAHADATLPQVRAGLFVLLGFAGFFRFNELVNIQTNHVTIDTSRLYIKIQVPHSKTDQLRAGRTVFIAANGGQFCPLRLLETYLGMTGPLPHGSLLFQTLQYDPMKKSHRVTGKGIRYDLARRIIKQALQGIGEKSADYGTHSLRAGGATAAAAAGVGERVLQMHGRWSSASSKDKYIEESIDNRLSVTARILP